jgi:hypothetical protein
MTLWSVRNRKNDFFWNLYFPYYSSHTHSHSFSKYIIKTTQLNLLKKQKINTQTKMHQKIVRLNKHQIIAFRRAVCSFSFSHVFTYCTLLTYSKRTFRAITLQRSQSIDSIRQRKMRV